MKTVSFNIAGEEFTYLVEGETQYGKNEVLLEMDDNLISKTSWDKEGFTIQPFLTESLYNKVTTGANELIYNLISKNMNLEVPLSEFSLKNYHHFVNDEIHKKNIHDLRLGFPFEKFPINIEILEKRVSEVCGVEVTTFNKKLPFQAFYIRIVRPQKADNNPPHRDVWLDYYRNCVNIYLPLSGSNGKSALPIVSGSHYWSESDIERTVDGAKIEGFTYRVPSVTETKKQMNFLRPNPGINEFMVFSPYLIHGGGNNNGLTETRSSIEIRFFRK